MTAELSGDGNNNHQFHQTSLPSLWAHVVRGEPEAISGAPRSPSSSSSSPPPPVVTAGESTFSDCSDSRGSQPENSDGNNINVDHPKKPAWNTPSNGVVEVGPVMGDAVSWPALSESTRPPPKSTTDSSKSISDASVSAPSQVPVISNSPHNQKHTTTNPNSKFTPNHTLPVRQRPSKRGGGARGGSGQSGFSRHPPPPPPPPPPLPPPFPLFEMPYGTVVPAMPDASFREPPYKGNNWEGRPLAGFVSQSHQWNDQPFLRNSSRRGNFGYRPRGDGPHHSTHGSRRYQDRDWNASRSSNSRDAQQMALPGGFVRSTTPGSTPFITPQTVRPFGNPMGFEMTSQYLYVPTLPPESFRGVPFIPHGPPPPAMFFPVFDPTLPTLIVNQIDYYFSDANLVKDDYLRSNMDDEGWVPIALIARFPRVQQLTNNIQLILDSLRASMVVEVQGDKVRRRDEWRKWIPTSGRFTSDSSSQPPDISTYDTLTSSLQKVALDEATSNKVV